MPSGSAFRRSRPLGWPWWTALIAAVATVLVLGFLLALSTKNSTRLEPYYGVLMGVNVALATGLLLVIGASTWRMWQRVRQGRFGGRLLFKIATTFALVGVLPGLVIYTVSYQFVSRSIQSWFDVQVEGALAAGLALGQSTLQSRSTALEERTLVAASRLASSPGAPNALDLERLREQLGVDELAWVGDNGELLVSVGRQDLSGLERRPPRLSGAWLESARRQRAHTEIEGLDEDLLAPSAPGVTAHIHSVARVPSRSFSLSDAPRYVYLSEAIEPEITRQALAVQTAYQEYQQRSLARSGLQRMYIGTLTLTLILAVFGALILAFSLARQLAQPLLLLAQGMREVAKGNLTPKSALETGDELGGLTRSFAAMTRQLADARSLAQRSVEAVDSARANLQTILDNLNAGVLVFDAQGRIETINPGATRIVRLPLFQHQGERLQDVPGLEVFGQAVMQRFDTLRHHPEPGERLQWQEVFELPRNHQDRTPQTGPQEGAPSTDTLTLLVRGAAMPQGASLLVFDDITDVVSAQRTAAWGEVARRLAHEIKNPLTPIQLSAERLEHKLGPKLADSDRSMLSRSVHTIVQQVQALITLVNEFRDYARLPKARFEAVDLNALMQDVLALYGEAVDSGRLTLETDPRLPLLRGDPSQLRQVIHNLVQNALDAVESQGDGQVLVISRTIRNPQGEAQGVRLRIQDNGPGFDEKVLHRAFEPYITTKAKGTGLGLAVVRKIMEEHGAQIRLANLPATLENTETGGAQVSISFTHLVPGEAPAASATPLI